MSKLAEWSGNRFVNPSRLAVPIRIKQAGTLEAMNAKSSAPMLGIGNSLANSTRGSCSQIRSTSSANFALLFNVGVKSPKLIWIWQPVVSPTALAIAFNLSRIAR